MRVIETIVIVVGLASLWPIILGWGWAETAWYRLAWLPLVLAGLVWVTVRRLGRIRAAAEEAKQKRDAAERSSRPPWLGG